MSKSQSPLARASKAERQAFYHWMDMAHRRMTRVADDDQVELALQAWQAAARRVDELLDRETERQPGQYDDCDDQEYQDVILRPEDRRL